MAVLKVRDPADSTGQTWITLPSTGPTGPTGPMGEGIYIGSDDPAPTTELWYDTDDNRVLGKMDMPPGGTVGQPLVKKTDIDGDVEWADLTANGLAASTSSNVVWQNGFSGTCDLRISLTTVTLRMLHVSKNTTETGASVSQWKMFDYPSGVPAPWANMVQHIPLYTGDTYSFNDRHVMVHPRTDGVWMQLYAGDAPEDYTSGDRIACTITWTR